MENSTVRKKAIEDIRKKIEASKGTHIWGDYVNALKLISQVVFTRSSGFILELIQNADCQPLNLIYFYQKWEGRSNFVLNLVSDFPIIACLQYFFSYMKEGLEKWFENQDFNTGCWLWARLSFLTAFRGVALQFG